MESQEKYTSLTSFEFEGKSQPVVFVQPLEVTEGVVCDVYSFVDDETKDLGIIKIEPGCKTPLQRVLQGERTIEGYVSGKGKLVVIRKENRKEIYNVGGESSEPLSVRVKVGDLMQWQAAEDSSLLVSEVCFPPYEEGRFENIEE